MMKMISWNVNGIRACVSKGFLDSMQAMDADIICLQETKVQAGQIELDEPPLTNYHQYWNYAQRKGYSGTAIFTKEEPRSVQLGLGIPNHDTEGRVITLEFDAFYLVTVYTPNAQNELARIDHRMGNGMTRSATFCKGLEEGVLPAGVPVERAGADGNVVLRPEAGLGEREERRGRGPGIGSHGRRAFAHAMASADAAW